ncbi:MAG TPA: amino acid permease [Lentisphaeria bacterium]|nr:MAG: hypothetical protein A2X47_13740 [Lentisphaerae bacterium GWF2_38_69]HBM17393.1 amino acid permease [Lentisphaeria bacterium]
MQQRSIPSIGLLFISVSAILGSGWLFGSFYAAQAAGPASIMSWIIGGVFVIIIAFTFAELCSSVPVSGSSVRIPQMTHGTVVGIFCSLNTWFCYVTLTVIETMAVMQYLSFYFPAVMHIEKGGLTLTGYTVATILLFCMSVVNTYSVKYIVRFNTFLTLLKIVIPIFVSILFVNAYFSIHSASNPQVFAAISFAPFGWHGIFAAISVGGIVFSYNAFKQAAEMAGEAKNPSFSVPFAIVGSVVLCMIIFLFLQIGFLSSLTSNDLKNGWSTLTLLNNQSPFVSLLVEHKINWAIPILYFAAIISPLAAALIYCTSAARSLYGIAANGYAPQLLLKLNKNGESALTVWINFILAVIIFQFFKNWDQISNLLTCLFAISYGLAPVCMVALRVQLPSRPRPLKLPFGYIWGYVAFFLTTLFIYWVGWDTISSVVWFFLFCLIATIIFQKTSRTSASEIKTDWKASIWLWAYLVVIVIASKLGDYGNGAEIMTGLWSVIFLAVCSAIVFAMAAKFTLPAQKIQIQIDAAISSKNDSGH